MALVTMKVKGTRHIYVKNVEYVFPSGVQVSVPEHVGDVCRKNPIFDVLRTEPIIHQEPDLKLKQVPLHKCLS